MTNPLSAMFDDARETLIFVIFVVMIIFILASLGVAFRMPELTNDLIESIGFSALLILAIPPIGVFIAIIVWITKSTESVGI